LSPSLSSWPGARRQAWLILCLAALGGCAAFPHAGPTVGDIKATAGSEGAASPGFAIQEITPDVMARIEAETAPKVEASSVLPPAGEVDAIGPGDDLQVSVFEVGSPLFSGRSGAATPAPGSPPAAAGENLPAIVVGRDGSVVVPYVGRIQAAGLTTDALASVIQAGLAHHSQAPQVVVSIRTNVANTVVVMGDVKKPGRIPLTLAHERLLDAIALAGGANNLPADEVVRLSRGSMRVEMPLGDLTAGAPDDVRLAPQDRVELEVRPRSYAIFGATGKVSEVSFATPRVSLAEAIARAGGPSDQQADPTAVFVFRYELSTPDGRPAARPVAYRLNLMQAQSYFLAQRFEMKPHDVIYIANARSDLPMKLLQAMNLFFQPVYTAKVVSQ
jgi:polysaccharide export outer membrane protein